LGFELWIGDVMKTRSEQINDIRLEYEMRMQQARRDYERNLRATISQLHWEFVSKMNQYTRWPMTRQGQAIRAYIRQYKGQQGNE
jgi:hypothetical protein